MVIWLCLRWWYTAGWQWAFERGVIQRLQWCNETFSITGLLKTLFAPFKQNQASGRGSLEMRFRIMIDNLVSRLVGFFARSFIILAGGIAALFVLITGLVFVAIWPLIPVTLPVALILMVAGVGK